MPISQNDYLEIQGNLTHCWNVHKRIMQNEGKPWVTYQAFRNRIKLQGWDLYRAIHTPANVNKIGHNRRRRVWWYRVKLHFRNLFKRLCQVKY